MPNSLSLPSAHAPTTPPRAITANTFGMTMIMLKKSANAHTRSLSTSEPMNMQMQARMQKGTTAFLPKRYCMLILPNMFQAMIVENAKKNNAIATNQLAIPSPNSLENASCASEFLSMPSAFRASAKPAPLAAIAFETSPPSV